MHFQTVTNRPCRIARDRVMVDRKLVHSRRAGRYTDPGEWTLRSLEPGMTDQARAVLRPWRSYLRFSIRGLIVLVLVIGLGLGWIVRSARIQLDAVAAIEDAGGRVMYDWEWNGGEYTGGGKPWEPAWLVHLIGVDYFGQVTLVIDATTVQFGHLPQKRRPPHIESAINDATLVHLEGMTKLAILVLNESKITDAGLANLKGLTNLSELDLFKTQVTDAGLVHLKVLTKLSYLDLSYTQVTDAGFAHLKGLTNLSEIFLHGTQVTDAGLEDLKQALPSLKIAR
jgi:internalin A